MGPRKRLRNVDDSEDESNSLNSQTSQKNSTKTLRKVAKGTHVQSDKLDLILKKLVSIENQNTEIVSKVRDMENRIVLTENELKTVREDCDVLTCSVNKLQTDINSFQQNPSSSNSDLYDSVSRLLLDSSARRSENELIYAELNKLNLLISGIAEPTNENNTTFAHEVERMILDITGKKITIDVAHRVGRILPRKNRMIKVRFLSILERNCVYFHKSKLPHPYYINEDLSPVTRSDHSLLRKKRFEILQRDKDATLKIDWRNKTIQHDSTSYDVKEGVLVQSTLTTSQHTFKTSIIDARICS
jgi:hypothetical protein